MTPRPEKTGLSNRKSEKFKSPIIKKDNFEKDDSFSWIEKPFGYDQQITNIIAIVGAHIFAFYYSYLYFTKQVDPKSIIFEISYALFGGLGTTIGCHRYWTHKTFKANKPLQILLMMMHTISLQYPIYKWCLDHRIHHKYTDTDADPHNSKRGFWFSHMGWLFLPKTEQVKEKLKTFDMPDLENDPILRFQSRRYFSLVIVLHWLIPISVYYFVFDMPLIYGYMANCRGFIMNLHATSCVNSFAHLCGDKPYDKTISSVENKIVAFFAAGEGWHNYHHTFPWDYRASEFPWKLNLSTMIIDFFASIGWAWDMKTVSKNVIQEKMKKTGYRSCVTPSGRYPHNDELWKPVNSFEDSKPSNLIWGWDDENMTEEMKQVTDIINPV